MGQRLSFYWGSEWGPSISWAHSSLLNLKQEQELKVQEAQSGQLLKSRAWVWGARGREKLPVA